MERTVTALGIHGACELQDRGFQRADGTQHHGDDGQVAPGFGEQLFGHCKHHISARLRDLLIGQHQQRDRRERHEQQQHDGHRDDRAAPWGIGRIARLFVEVDGDIPAPEKKQRGECTSGKQLRGELGDGKPVQRDRVRRVCGKLDERRDDDGEQHADFDAGHHNLGVAGRLDAFDNDRADRQQPARGDQGHGGRIIRQCGFNQQQSGRGCGNRAGHHEHCRGHQQGPASKKTEHRIERRAHPGVRRAGIRVAAIEVQIGK